MHAVKSLHFENFTKLILFKMAMLPERLQKYSAGLQSRLINPTFETSDNLKVRFIGLFVAILLPDKMKNPVNIEVYRVLV